MWESCRIGALSRTYPIQHQNRDQEHVYCFPNFYDHENKITALDTLPDTLRFNAFSVPAIKFLINFSSNPYPLRSGFDYAYELKIHASNLPCGFIASHASILPSSMGLNHEFVLLGHIVQSPPRRERNLMVVLIQRVGKYAERVALCEFDEKAWEAAQPTKKDIVLG